MKRLTVVTRADLIGISKQRRMIMERRTELGRRLPPTALAGKLFGAAGTTSCSQRKSNGKLRPYWVVDLSSTEVR